MWPKGKKRVVQEVDGVSTDDIAERIEQFEDLVQSVDIVSFNKL